MEGGREGKRKKETGLREGGMESVRLKLNS